MTDQPTERDRREPPNDERDALLDTLGDLAKWSDDLYRAVGAIVPSSVHDELVICRHHQRKIMERLAIAKANYGVWKETQRLLGRDQ